MKRWGLRIWFLAVLICSFSCSLSWVRAEGLVLQGDEHKEYIKQHDGLVNLLTEKRQQPFGEALIKSESPQNVNASRSTRLLPTHGGKPGKSIGNGSHSNSSNTLKRFHLCKFVGTSQTRMGVASPRSYYVIALRRILC